MRARRFIGLVLIVVGIVLIMAGVYLITYQYNTVCNGSFGPMISPGSSHSHPFPFALVGLVLVILGSIMLIIGVLLLVVKLER